MSCATTARDTVESVASLAGNYELPGSSLLTDKLVSKGSQKQLSSPLGEVAQVATGLTGSGVGSGITGIPQSAGGAAEASAFNALTDEATQALGGVENFLGITPSTTASGNAISIGDSALGTSGGTGATPSLSPAGATVGAGSAGDIASEQVGTALTTGDIAGTSTPASTSLGTLAPGGGETNLAAASPSGLTAGDTNFLKDAATSAATTNASAPGLTAGTGDVGGGGILKSLGISPKTALATAFPISNIAYQAIKGTPSLPSSSQALSEGGGVTGPLIATEQADLAAANAGQLTPAQQASVDQYIKNAQNQLLQQLAAQGVTNPTADSRYVEGIKSIQAQALALQQQLIQQTLSNAFSAAGAASGNLATVANQQITADQEFQNALRESMNSLGGIVAGVESVNGRQGNAAL